MNIINTLFFGAVFFVAATLSILEDDIEYLLYVIAGIPFGILVTFSYQNITTERFFRLLSILILLIIGAGSIKLYWLGSAGESFIGTIPDYLYLVIAVLATIIAVLNGLRFAVLFTVLGSYLARLSSFENK